VFGGPVTILHRIESAKDRPQVPVTDALGILERVLVKAALPEPLPVMVARVREIGHRQWQRPGCLREGLGHISLIPGPHVAHAHPAGGLHHRFSSGEVADRGMTGGITEKPAGESQFLAGAGVEAGDCLNPRGVRRPLDGKGMRVEEEINVWLTPDNLLFFGIAELLVRAGALFGMITELLDDFPDPWIPTPADQAHRPNPDLA